MICSQGTFKFQGPGVQDLRRSELNMQLVVSTGSESDRKRVVVVLTLLLICSVVIKGFTNGAFRISCGSSFLLAVGRGVMH